MAILLTGYELLADHDANPSATLAARLDGEQIGRHDVIRRVLLVEFGHMSEAPRIGNRANRSESRALDGSRGRPEHDQGQARRAQRR